MDLSTRKKPDETGAALTEFEVRELRDEARAAVEALPTDAAFRERVVAANARLETLNEVLGDG